MEDPEIQALYGLPLADFVAARNTLAKAKKRLAPDLAEELKKLAKPTVSAWIINQWMRLLPDRVHTLLSAIDRVRAVQLAALSGGTELSLREAMKEEKEALLELEQAGEAALVAAGQSPGKGPIEKALKALHAAALDLEGRQALERGCLHRDYEEPGFGGLTSGVPIAPLPQGNGTPKPGVIELDGRRAELAARKRAEDLRALEERRHTHKKKIEGLETQLEAQRSVEVRLKAELQSLERTVAEARRKFEEADRIAQVGRDKLGEAEKKRAELETKLAELESSEP